MIDRRAKYKLAMDSQILRDRGAELCKPSPILVKLTPDGCKIRNGEDAHMLDLSLASPSCSQKAGKAETQIQEDRVLRVCKSR